ncbi:hypothetical protein KJ603_02040, partial [Patescibacteria group bacterium]|nr:hypothetical protein [Patescibacteria group bacterium]
MKDNTEKFEKIYKVWKKNILNSNPPPLRRELEETLQRLKIEIMILSSKLDLSEDFGKSLLSLDILNLII